MDIEHNSREKFYRFPFGMEDLEKVHKKMITYCEKVVNKDGEQIQSAFVKYVDDVTAK